MTVSLLAFFVLQIVIFLIFSLYTWKGTLFQNSSVIFIPLSCCICSFSLCRSWSVPMFFMPSWWETVIWFFLLWSDSYCYRVFSYSSHSTLIYLPFRNHQVLDVNTLISCFLIWMLRGTSQLNVAINAVAYIFISGYFVCCTTIDLSVHIGAIYRPNVTILHHIFRCIYLFICSISLEFHCVIWQEKIIICENYHFCISEYYIVYV